ncbi:sigma-54-dependent Fis family transcriptional regulator [Desulfosarcina alkanivorans]|uniref:Sigma-54-dependent Fis family transcriptional regulator n=1 Tax=Desulfosarcina alkanivorans TaxID=571177 RepID=A0A5K7YN33_9BACT|nr:sigma-54-dependent Fis family transcriptional regulator [Desulfosarcina alkanivorans]BBO68301.1 sigma-54-dependent Fis family transcriptional regulator [Desulfosarcina alkanivorans]
MNKKILVVDDEESIRFTFENFLTEAGYRVATASSYDQALDCLDGSDFDLIFVDIIMEGQTGIELLRTVKDKNPNAQVIMITGAPSVETASEALRLGALDYILKPVRQRDLLKAADLAFRHKRIADEKDHCRSNVDAIFKSVKDGIVTVDKKMRVVDANQAAEALCGFSRDDSPGAFIRTVTRGCGGACVEVLKEALATREAVELRHVECHRKDTVKQIVSVRATPLIDRRDHFSGCVMVLRDETRLFDLEKNVNRNSAFDRMVGTSAPMRQVTALIKALADVQTTVLITGESGTGKELAVDALHRAGERSTGPLVKVNCGALTESILESELFGHVKGAFTGAAADKIGRFQKADGGTLFLDEIGDISPKMQLQLLRVIETGTFEPVGSAQPMHADVRVVAATNRDLAARVAEGAFREDLYYRLKVVQIQLPPLRQRKTDIPLLTRHMIGKFNRKFNKTIKAVSSDVERLFQRHAWTGNVRELENTLEHAFILCNQPVLTLSHLPADLQARAGGLTLFNSLDRRSEVAAIEKALRKTDGNKAKAARLLSMSRRTIYRKIEKYNIAG